MIRIEETSRGGSRVVKLTNKCGDSQEVIVALSESRMDPGVQLLLEIIASLEKDERASGLGMDVVQK